MFACGCADETPASQPRVLSTLHRETDIRRRLTCDHCARTWLQIELREADDADR